MSIANRKANGVNDKLDDFLDGAVGNPATAFFLAQMTGKPALGITRLLEAAADGHGDHQARLKARLNLNLMLSTALPGVRKRMSTSMRRHAMGLVT